VPIVRTLGCNDCARTWDVTLTAEQVDDPLPACPFCNNATFQEFKPVAIRGKESKLESSEAVVENEMKERGITDITFRTKENLPPKVRYKTDKAQSNWMQPTGDMVAQAAQLGRADRQKFGADGLEILQNNLRSGKQVDLVEASKRRADRVWTFIPAALVGGSLGLLFAQGMQLI